MKQKTKRLTILSLFIAAWAWIPAVHAASLIELVAKMPAQSVDEFNAIHAEIVQLGEERIAGLCRLLFPPGSGDDAKIRFAVSGVAKYASRNSANMDRKTVCRAFLRALENADDVEVKAFLMRQIQVVGKEEAVAPLSRYLSCEILCEPAAQALLAIQTANAAEALLQALPQSDGSRRITIIKALGDLQCKAAVKEILPFAESDDETTRCVALYALANIGDPSCAEVLAQAAEANTPYQRAQATSYYLLFANQLAENGETSLCSQICRKLIETRTDESEANVQSAALRTLLGCEGENALQDLLAATKSVNQEVQAAALALAAQLPSEEMTKKWIALSQIPASKIAEAAHAVEEGFTSLFNGNNLTGWIGDVKGYVIEDGAIVCKPGGNLYTEKEYDNFIIRFEFKLTPGANNGLGIRTPTKGDAAYVGMELQIIDNTADIYKNIQPWQKHGSIYGIVPAKTGFLKPVGEWNDEEVIADGPHITINLNGETIVDTNLDESKPIDNHDHPGMKNTSGHIGFLGHGSRVEFRNIRIKELH
ncbi:MAG: DUF1080 domain-containing protein [Candidatus Omnitrophota bacterium]|jgi:hypothetical protein|nr:MAG: DUF1080 domain-containing protein [Candidatus Omnitrophota bacterium]